MVHVPGCVPFCACSLYLFHSQGLSEANWEIFSAVGNVSRELGVSSLLGLAGTSGLGSLRGPAFARNLGRREVKVTDDSPLAPRRPVTLQFHSSLGDLKALALCRPPGLPVEAAVGPAPCPGDWDGALALAQEAFEAMGAGDARGARRLLSPGYK
eukprot:1878513-Pyramimonas_sp.AAC.1